MAAIATPSPAGSATLTVTVPGVVTVAVGGLAGLGGLAARSGRR